MAGYVPIVLLWTGAALAMFLDGRRRWVGACATAVLAGALILVLYLLAAVSTGPPLTSVTGEWAAGVGIRLRVDALGALFAAISLLALLGAAAYETARGVESRFFPAQMLFVATGLTGLFFTADAFNFYVFFEISMIASFALAAYGGGPREVRASTVFALANLIGSAIFLAAIAALYRLTGTLDIPSIGRLLSRTEATPILVATLFFVALGLKLGLFPFHFWLPSVYRSARPVIAAVLSGAVANIGSYGLLRFGLELFADVVVAARPVLIAFGAATIAYGGLLAASRREASVVLAYSAIGQTGYVLVALAIGGPIGVAAAVIYATVNAVNKVVLFLASDLRGWRASAAFAIGGLSVAGIPPTYGFVGKVELFRLGVAEQSSGLLLLVFLGGALSLIYMFQSYQHRFWAKGATGGHAPRRLSFAVLSLAGLLVGIGLWPEPLLFAGAQAAAALGAP